MRQYIWYHPSYIEETDSQLLRGQIHNAKKHGYILLKENELDVVGVHDHLTIVGHSTPPKVMGEENGNDSGYYLQGETAQQCVIRLQQHGLKEGPRLLSLECCNAAIPRGIAKKLSCQKFFNSTVIEANTSAIGRNPGNIKWSMVKDNYGRVILNTQKSPWFFFLSGNPVVNYKHGTYQVEQVVEDILQHDFHTVFFSYYKPGFFGGRVNRHCMITGLRITLSQAEAFASEEPGSATETALLKIKEEYDILTFY